MVRSVIRRKTCGAGRNFGAGVGNVRIPIEVTDRIIAEADRPEQGQRG
jgi:hypothetical protein